MDKVIGEDLGAEQPPWALAGVGFHRLSIIGPWLAPKGGCEGSMCKDMAGKVVPRSVGGL